MRLAFLGGIGRALGHREYAVYWSGNAVNTFGRWMYRVAMGWLTWELTKSTEWLGIIAFAETFPMVIFSLLAGAIADRTGYLRVTLLAQVATAVSGIALAAITLAGAITIELVFVFALLVGSLEALTTPARMSLVNALVPRADLSAAIALNSATFNASRFAGPAVASALLVWIGSGAVLAIVALTFTQFCFVLMRIRISEPPRTPAPARALLGDMVSGIRHGFADPGIRFLLIMLGGTGLLIRPVMELMPGLSEIAFDRGADGLGIMLSAIGLGGTLSGIWLAQRGETIGLTRLVTLSLLLQGAAVIAACLTGNIWIAAGFFVVVGFFMLVGGIGSQTLIQNAVAAEVRARVMSLYIIISWGLPAFGALAAGWIAAVAGLQVTIAAGGALTIAMWLWARPRAAALAPALEDAASVTPTGKAPAGKGPGGG